MFKGEYKNKNTSGKPVTYTQDDIVVYQGKVYKTLIQTQKSPLQAPKNWEYVGLNETFSGSNPPVKPYKGQIWINGNGNQYLYYDDGNTTQWIQI